MPRHRVIRGDCVRVMRTLPSGSVDLVVTSPPYSANKSYEKGRSMDQDAYRVFSEDWLAACYPLLRAGGNMFVNTGYWSGSRGGRFFLPTAVIAAAEGAGFRFTGWINWVKGRSVSTAHSGNLGWGDIYGTSPFFRNGTEPILHFRKGRGKHRDNKHDEWLKLVREPWVMPVSLRRDHDASFPHELPRRCIRLCSLPGDTVLDPFGGSGTTGAAARSLGRRSVTIERDPQHYKTCVETIRRGSVGPPRKESPPGGQEGAG